MIALKTIALIIGASEYIDPAFKQLPGASHDASNFSKALISWGLPPEWIITITNEKATKAEVIKAFYKCRAEFDVEAKFIFYFAGHGVRELDESFLVLQDTSSQDIANTGLRLVELMQLIRTLRPIQTFMFIDACKLRLNNIDNPLNDTEIFSTSNSKGLFCIFSSGTKPSYEDPALKSGYFTQALIKAIDQLRHLKQPTCHDILQKVENRLLQEQLPAPESYHVGSSNIWPLEKTYTFTHTNKTSESSGYILREQALAILHDYVNSTAHPIVWMWGERGLGKTIIAEQLVTSMTAQGQNAIYVSIAHGQSLHLQVQHVIEQIRQHKSELFFNRAPDSMLCLALAHLFELQKDAIIVVDHLDRLQPDDMAHFLMHFDAVNISTIFISRSPLSKHLFKTRSESVLEWQVPTFSVQETENLIQTFGMENSLSALLMHQTHGHALKTKQMLIKLSGKETPLEGKMTKDSIKCIKAIVACGGFLDEHLFCQIHHIKPSSITTLEQFGLLRRTKEGYFPHDTMEDLVEQHKWRLQLIDATSYWNMQVLQTPFNRFACRSLVLLATQSTDCRPFKRALGQCLVTLNEREYSSFLLDLVEIFKKHNWVELLLEASDYLIDHEEYNLSGSILQELIGSEDLPTKHHAIKNAIRRLVWIGQYPSAIELYAQVADECQSEPLQVAMRNHVAIAHFFLGQLDTALELFRINLEKPYIADERELGITKYMTGLIWTYRNEEITKAKRFIETSIMIFESTKFYHWTIVGLNGLADLCYREKKFDHGLHCLNKALETAEALQNKTFLIFTLKNIARIELRIYGAHHKALAETTTRMEALLQEILVIGHNWATMWAQNVLCTVYAHQKNAEKMQKHLLEVSQLTKHYDECHIFSLSNLGHFAAIQNQNDLAIRYYDEAYSLCNKVHNPFARHEIRQDFLDCQFSTFLQKPIEEQI